VDDYKTSQVASDIDLDRLRVCRDHAQRALKELERILLKAPELETSELPWQGKLLGLPVSVSLSRTFNLVVQLAMALDKAYVFRSPIPESKKAKKKNKRKLQYRLGPTRQQKNPSKSPPLKAKPAKVLLKRSTSEE
jgi:hypothetical protein